MPVMAGVQGLFLRLLSCRKLRYRNLFYGAVWRLPCTLSVRSLVKKMSLEDFARFY